MRATLADIATGAVSPTELAQRTRTTFATRAPRKGRLDRLLAWAG